MEKRILIDSAEGLELSYCPVKGRTVKATREFIRGEHVINYSGEIITENEAKRREEIYDESPEDAGSYMLYFKFKPSANRQLNIPLW